jgi:two-component system sensor histidine kinase UhpB
LPVAVRRALEERHARERHLAMQRRLKLLSSRLIEVQEHERRRIARELHDDIGQALTALKIQLESFAAASADRAMRERLAASAETAAHALERVRLLSLSLRPPQLDDLGLAAALRSHLDRQAAVGRLTPHFEARDVPRNLPPEVETACFRVAQEAINNVLRHAEADNVWVRLDGARRRLVLTVRDDGKGFDPEAALRGAAGGASLGLASMEERATLARGALEVRAAPGCGTTVTASFALEPESAGQGD